MKYYLLAFILILGCSEKQTKIAFPRIVKNGCGRYAVQTTSSIKKENFADGSYTIDTVYQYEGMKERDWFRGINYISSDTSVSISLLKALGLSGYTDPPPTISQLKDRHYAEVFSGDTIYDAGIGFELQFEKREDAQAVMQSYINKQNLVIRYDDSIDNCHNYKP
jgi:hypothetical protein